MNTLNIKPRQSGKTTSLKKLGKKLSYSGIVVVVCPTLDMTREYSSISYKAMDQTMFFENLLRRGLMPSYYLIDEYFSTNSKFKKEIFLITLHNNVEVHAYGTPVKQYLESDVSLCRAWWSAIINRSPLVKLLPNIDTMIKNYSEDLMYNLIVNPLVQVNEVYDDYNHLSKEQYEMEILGKIFKEK